MQLETTIDGIDPWIKSLTADMVQKVLHPAVKETATFLEMQYRLTLFRIRTKPGNSGIESYLATGSKVRMFKDGSGVWAVIGATTSGGRMLAPQMRFGEHGTAERWTKDGSYRGFMPTQAWLQLTLRQNMPKAQDMLRSRINHFITRARTV